MTTKTKGKLDAIDRITRHVASIADGSHETVRPGLPYRISEASSPGDAVAQGDLCLEVHEGDPPAGYVRVERLTEADKQLVPGETRGARHCLDSLDGAEMWRPKDWPNATELGPLLRLTEERTVLHPVHGDVTIPAGVSILCSYDREYDAIQRAARRNAD